MHSVLPQVSRWKQHGRHTVTTDCLCIDIITNYAKIITNYVLFTANKPLTVSQKTKRLIICK